MSKMIGDILMKNISMERWLAIKINLYSITFVIGAYI